MKKILNAIVLPAMAVILSITGCREGNGPDHIVVNFETDEINAEAVGGEMTVRYTVRGAESFNCANINFIADDGWAHSFDKSEDGILRFTVDANTDSTVRVTYIKPIHEGTEIEGNALTVSQKGSATEDVWRGMDFSIRVEIEGYSVTVYVTPEDDTKPYYFDIYPADDFHDMGMTLDEFARSVIDELIEFYTENMGLSKEEIIDGIYSTGPDMGEYGELTAGTEFMAYAFELSSEGEILSDVRTEMFSTPEVEQSDNTITINEGEVSAVSIEVNYNASNDDVYFYDLVPAAGFEGMTDDEIMKKEIREWGGNISYSLISGNFTYQFNKLEPDTEYLALAFGYQAGVNTTPLTKKSIRTLPAGNPGECTFEFEIKPIGTSLSVSVTPSDETVNYFWNLYGADATQEEMKAAVLESLESTLAEGYYENEMEFWLNETARGNDTYLFMGLDKEKEYKAGAVAIDLTTCEMVGDFTESEIISFKSESSTSIKVSYEKYFNGDEAAALSPEYSEFTGKAMVPFTVQVSGATTYRWVVTEWEEDYDSASDGMFWSTLGWDGYENEAFRYVALEWDKDYTVYAMSVDADGNKSERFSMPVRFSRDGASPINELTE